MLSSDQPRNALTTDVTTPWDRERSASGKVSWRGAILSTFDRLYSDKRGSISRPKLLFTLSLVDMAVIGATGLVAHAVANPATTSLFAAAMLSVLMALSTTVALRRNWSYSIHALRHSTGQIEKIIKAVVSVFLLIAGGLHIAGLDLYSPSAMLLWLAMAAMLLIASRFVVARMLAYFTAAGRLVRRTVLVGGGPDAEALIAALEGDNVKELHILGVFDDRFDERSADNTAGYPKLGNFRTAPRLLPQLRRRSLDHHRAGHGRAAPAADPAAHAHAPGRRAHLGPELEAATELQRLFLHRPRADAGAHGQAADRLGPRRQEHRGPRPRRAAAAARGTRDGVGRARRAPRQQGTRSSSSSAVTASTTS